MRCLQALTGRGGCLLPLLLCLPDGVMAAPTSIDKIYHPYVQPLEREIELRGSIEQDGARDAEQQQLYHLGYGQALNDNWMLEGYLMGRQARGSSLQLFAYELEALWQITEQGEYLADWGMLFELERVRSENITEASAALLLEKDWGRWTSTANLYAIYEFGNDIDNGFEAALNAQLRYRYKRMFEPALELYTGKGTLGLGPVVMGAFQLGGGRKLHWEAGDILGLDSGTADHTFRLLLEYEF